MGLRFISEIRVTTVTRSPVFRSLGAAHYVFALVLVVRVLALARLTSSPFLLPSGGDMHFYDEWAQRIARGQLTDSFAFYGLPLYAYLLALFYKVVGYGPFFPGLLQAILDAGTATLLFQLPKSCFGETAGSARTFRGLPADSGTIIGIAAAAGWALFVPAQAYSVILMPAAWLTFVFWFLVWRIVKLDHSPGALASFLFGLLTGITAMGIATILFLVPLLFAAIILRRARACGKGIGFAKAGAIAMVVVGIIAGASPCWIHNYFIARDPVFLSAHSGVNFWIGNNPVANGYPKIPPGLRAGQKAMLQDSITEAEAAAGHALKRSEVSAFWSAKAKSYIGSRFGEWLSLMTLKARNLWNAFQYDDLSIITNLREHGVILPGIGFGLVAALALPGMLLGWVRLPRSRWIAAGILLHMASVLTVFVTERYRLAAVPGLLLFAAFALWKLWEFCATARVGPAAGMIGAISVATWFVSLPQRDPALWALDAYNSGRQALESGNLPLAQQKLELAYAYVPGNAEINLALGNLWLQRKDYARAEHYYLATLELEPSHKSALTNLGLAALDQRRLERAAALFNAALRAAPDDAKVHYFLGRAEWESGNSAAARAEIETAIRLDPDQPEFLQFRDLIAP